MSYRIQYQREGKKPKRNYTAFRRELLTILCFLLFVTMVVPAWPQAAQLIHDTLEPFRPAVVVAAMDELALSLQQGTSIMQAFRTFVQHVIQKIGMAAG